MSNIKKRIIFGSLYIASILIAAISTISMCILLILIATLATFEIKKIFQKQKINFNSLSTLIIGYSTFISILKPEFIGVLFLTILIYLFGLMYKNLKDPIINASTLFFSVIYIFIPLPLIILIGNQSQVHEYKTVIGLFILIWSSDSWAYACGKLFGNRKLYELISPKKTWEGFIGAIFFTTSTGLLLSFLEFGLSPLEWGVLGMITAFFATTGDLFQSMLKRSSNIKDTGNILPGHGGILDRIDSILFCFPVYYVYFYHFKPLMAY